MVAVLGYQTLILNIFFSRLLTRLHLQRGCQDPEMILRSQNIRSQILRWNIWRL